MGVLITGGAGYIGSHMAHAMADRGEDVIVLDNLSTGNVAAIPKEAAFFKGDVGNTILLNRIFSLNDIDAVIHFAGSTVVPESVVEPLAYYENNTSKSRTLIEACVRAGVKRFIFSSTAAVYGMPETGTVSEAAPTNPISPYGMSKLMTEFMLRDAAVAHGFAYMALRYFNVAGADPDGRTGQSTPGATHLVKLACETALGLREKLSIFGTDHPTPDGTCIRDYIHVSDLVAAHALALDHLRRGGRSQTLNCGYGRGHSVREVVEAVNRNMGMDLPIVHAAPRAGDAVRCVADAGALRRVLGWEPRYDDLDTIVAHALAWEGKKLHDARADAPAFGRRRSRPALNRVARGGPPVLSAAPYRSADSSSG